MNSEDLLRSTLREKATEAHSTLTLDDVRRDAAANRRRSTWRRVALVAAAAAIATGVPTALLLRPTGENPSPASSPSPTISTSSAPAPAQTLERIPRGADPKISYVFDGVVHQPDGNTSRLPAGATDVTQFTPYHGGWLVIDSGGGLVQYDNTGKVERRSSSGDSAVAVSLDRTETAFQSDDHIVVGIGSGMGAGEVDHSIRAKGGGLVGFLRGGVVYNSQPGAIRVVGDTGKETRVENLETADATSWIGGLVSGSTDGWTRGRVVSTESGRVLWTSADWLPQKFSSDGRYVAAVPVGEEAHELAILDSRTGAVEATYSLDPMDASLSCPMSWDGETDAVLFCVTTPNGEAVLRLDSHGAVTRASAVRPAAEAPSWAFETTP